LIKSLLILVLSLILVTGAFLSRPAEGDVTYLRKEAKGMTFHDRYLWAQLEDREGRVIYTGVFGHWLQRGTWRLVKVGSTQVQVKGR
jgi:hypothetical protein